MLDAGTIRVEKAIAKAGGKKYETEPKTEASRRSVPVHPILATMLDQRRNRMVDELQEALGIKGFWGRWIAKAAYRALERLILPEHPVDISREGRNEVDHSDQVQVIQKESDHTGTVLLWSDRRMQPSVCASVEN